MNYFICGRLREKEIESVLTHLVSFLYIILCIFAVAPHAGAWIEIAAAEGEVGSGAVAPHAGAWIEITPSPSGRYSLRVAPHAGAWIEIVGRKVPARP